ncbi:MAG: M56 family metallopeptidase [Pirellulales bacterium]
MDGAVAGLGYWLADYYLATTLLLVVVWCATTRMHCPARRLSAVWLTTVAAAGAGCRDRRAELAERSSADRIRQSDRHPEAEVLGGLVEPTTSSLQPAKGHSVNGAPPRNAPSTLETTTEETFDDVPDRNTGGSWIDLKWSRRLAAVVAVGFVVGSISVIGWLVCGLAVAKVFLRRCQLAATDWVAELEAIAGDRSQRVRLLVSDRLYRAIVLGVARPAIVLPDVFLERESCDDVRDALRHEWAHVVHGDLWLAALLRMLMPLLYVQPLYWWLRRLALADQELLADDAVVRHRGRADYVAKLIRWSRQYGGMPQAPMRYALGLWERPDLLSRRVERLIDETPPTSAGASRTYRMRMALVLLCLTLAVSGLRIRPAARATPGDPGIGAESHSLALPMHEVAGTVLDELGRPLGGVIVDFCPWSPGHDCCSDASGRFRFESPAGDVLAARFSKQGFCPQTFDAVDLLDQDWTVQLSRDTVIEGRVLDAGGRALAGVLVRGNQGPKRLANMNVRDLWTETETAADGSYRLYVEPDEYDLQVRVLGHGVADAANVNIVAGETRQLDLRLSSGGRLRLELLDAANQTPVAGVTLSTWQRPDIAGTSSVDGVIEIDDLIPGRYRLDLTHDGYARWWVVGGADASNRQVDATGWQRTFGPRYLDVTDGANLVKVNLEPAAQISGRVVDPAGNVAVGATVSAVLTGRGRSISGDTRFTVTSAADGTYELVLPASGDCDYHLLAHDGAYGEWRHWANGVSAPLRTHPGERIDGCELRLLPPATVRGRVVDMSGRPVAGQHVFAHAADGSGNPYFTPAADTAADGSFEIRFVRPGAIQVSPQRNLLDIDEVDDGQIENIDVAAGETIAGLKLVVPTSSSRAEREFTETYRLGASEVIKLVPRREVQRRLKWEAERRNQPVASAVGQARLADRYRGFMWSGPTIDTHRKQPIFNTHPPRLSEVPERIVELPRFAYSISEEWLGAEIGGDSIVRYDAPLTEKLAGLETILRQQLDASLTLRPMSVARGVVIVRGVFDFRPSTGTFDDERIAFWIDELHTDADAGGCGGSVDALCRRLAELIDYPVVNLGNGPTLDRMKWAWHDSGRLRRLGRGSDRDAYTERLLAHVAQQSSLDFRVESHEVTVWVANDGEENKTICHGTRDSPSRRWHS